MAYSGTYDQTKITVDQLISYAYRDAGKPAEEITPEYINAGKQALFYILQNSVNRGINIWLQKIEVLGAQTNQTFLTMPKNTVDVLEANWVYITNPSISAALPADNVNAPILFDQSSNADLSQYATSTLTENWFGASYSQATRIFYAGFNAYSPNTTTTYDIDFQVSNDGVTWETWQSFPTVTLNDFDWSYITINATQQFYYYRLVNRNTTSTFSVRAIQFAQSQQVIPLARLNRDDYWNLPNKDFPSQRSLQYWYDRKIEPQMYLWPIPSNNFQMLQLIIESQIMDVGNLSNELYIPNRWLAAVQAWLSHELSMQIPGVDQNRIAYLEARYKEWLNSAEQEERDKSPIYFQPNYSYYTR